MSDVVLTFEEARRAVERQAAELSAPAAEVVELLEATGRVLAETVVADRDFPPFARATRDGYAVHAADVAQVPATLNFIGEIKAGEKLEKIPAHVRAGEAVGIMTGAPVPDDCDAVVMVEYTSRTENRVEILRSVKIGENVVPRGAEAKQGAALLARGTRLNEAAIAVAASAGKARVEVFRRPRVAILSTGDELVAIEASPGATEIRNSNTFSLAAQVTKAGAEPVPLPIAPDESGRLRELIEEGLKCDLLLLTGGVSMGRYDLVEQVLSQLQAEFFFTGAKIQPGKPVVFGKIPSRHKYFFGLPGNPVSTMVTFELFAKPLLQALAGMTPVPLRFLHAKLKTEIRVKPGLKRFLPATLSGEFENVTVEMVAWQGSGDIAATARANCYLVIPPDRERLDAGESVAVMLR